MSETKPTEPIAETPLSAEELENIHKQRVEFYEKNTPTLKLQAEYENYLAVIEESRLRRLTAMIRTAQLNSPPEAEPVAKDPEPEKPKERKLKHE